MRGKRGYTCHGHAILMCLRNGNISFKFEPSCGLPPLDPNFDMFPLSHHTPHSHEYDDEQCALKSGDLPAGGLPK